MRLIELALDALEAKRVAVEKEIQDLKEELATGTAKAGKVAKRPRIRRSAASRKAQSERMKAYWAKRRAAGKKRRKSAK